MDFGCYRTRSKYALQINQGYTAQLEGKGEQANPYSAASHEEKAVAWHRGWTMATKDQLRLARDA